MSVQTIHHSVEQLDLIRVNLLVIGAQKSGTTWLWNALKKHPKIQTGQRKEQHYFDLADNFRDRARDYRVYHSNFPPDVNCPSPAYLLDTTPSYLFESEVPGRIFEYNPDARLIGCLRNPVTRAYSQWAMMVLKGIESRDFKAAVKQEMADTCAGKPGHWNQAYFRRGLYFQQISRYLKLFPANQMLFLNQDDLLSDPKRELDRIRSFLELKNRFQLPSKKSFTHSYPGISPSDYDWLESHFRQENRSLAKLLKWDIQSWGPLPTARAPSTEPSADPASIKSYFDTYRKANRALESNDQETAIACHTVLRDFPGVGVDNRIRQAKLLLNLGIDERVFDKESSFLHIPPTTREHGMVLVRLWTRLNDIEMARNIGQETLLMDQNNTSMYWFLAQVAINNTEKIELLGRSIETNPFNLTSYILMCRAYRANREFHHCAATAQKGVEFCQFQDTSTLERFLS